MAQGLTSYARSSVKLTAAIKAGYFLEMVPLLFFCIHGVAPAKTYQG